MTEHTCMNCRFAVHADFGYSNYTTEGTTFACAKKLHPDGEFDEFYGDDKRLKFGADCTGFETGEGVFMDVDHENESHLTPEHLKIWDMHINALVASSGERGK